MSQPAELFTADYFERLLRADRSDQLIRVLEVRSQPAVGKGENFTSELQRITVRFVGGEPEAGEETARFIVKCELQAAPVVQELLEGLGLFRKEVECYTRVLPAVEKLLRSIGDDTKLSARCLDASLRQSYLVFEDLSVAGYATLRRQRGLSAAHFRLLFTKIAKWHAATAVLIQHDPTITAHYQAEQFDPANSSWKAIIENSATALADALQRLAAADAADLRAVGAKIEASFATLQPRYFEASVRRPEALNCISHGDLWSSNIMFRTDAASGQPDDVLLVDFQVGAYTSHIRDVQHCLYSSSERQLRLADWQQLVQHYHSVLADTLQRLKFTARPVPQLAEVWSEWRRVGPCAAHMLPYFAAVRQMEVEGGADMEKLSATEGEENRAYRRDIVLRPECRESLEFLMRYSEGEGFFG